MEKDTSKYDHARIALKHADIVQKLTLEEKASLCSGRDMWHFKGIERLGIPEVMVTDGLAKDLVGEVLSLDDANQEVRIRTTIANSVQEVVVKYSEVEKCPAGAEQ